MNVKPEGLRSEEDMEIILFFISFRETSCILKAFFEFQCICDCFFVFTHMKFRVFGTRQLKYLPDPKANNSVRRSNNRWLRKASWAGLESRKQKKIIAATPFANSWDFPLPNNRKTSSKVARNLRFDSPSHEHRVENDAERPHVRRLSRVGGVCAQNFRWHVRGTASFVLERVLGGVVQHHRVLQRLQFDLRSAEESKKPLAKDLRQWERNECDFYGFKASLTRKK